MIILILRQAEYKMALDNAILGFLQYAPLSGYDLKAVFDASVQNFWSADQSQIYRTLGKLEQQGLVEVEHVEQDNRPDRKVYHITDEGSSAFLQWLKTPLPKKGNHIAELIQIFFAGNLSDEDILILFKRLTDYCQKSLDHLRSFSIETGKKDKEVPKRDAFFWMLTLDYGICVTEANLKWLKDVTVRIENGEYKE